MKSLFSLFAILITMPSFAQLNMVNVDPLSGAANVTIPITTVSSGMASASINLSYSGNGVKVKDVEANAGIGWQVTGGGSISRELRGLPDDVKKDHLNNNRLGWLYNTNTGTIGSINFANTGTPNCTNEASDISTLNTYLTSLEDSEPDMFTVSAPGLSCKFIFDNSRIIKTIPYQDVKISYTTLTSGRIKDFKVITSAGIIYEFNRTNEETKQTTNTVAIGAGYTTINESDIVFFKTPYLQFKNRIDYSTSWYLTSITDQTRNQVLYTYDDGIETNAATPLELYVGSSAKTTFYATKTNSKPLILKAISGHNQVVTFNYANNYSTSVPMVAAIAVNGVNYLLNYSSVSATSGPHKRYFLREITTNQCNNPYYYRFNYYGETNSSGSYTSALADSTSKKIDFWGFQNSSSNADLAPSVLINPSTTAYQKYQIKTDNSSRSAYSYSVSGANRMVDTGVVKAGSLKDLLTLNGGITTIAYESNDYYDPTGNITVFGGGIRVKQVNVYDGFNGANNMIHNYSYINPSTGLTSGKPVTLPVYAFARPYTGSGTTAAQWEASTVRSELDLSAGDHSVLYSHVTSSQAGAGKTLYEYYLPATNYDANATPSCSGCTTVDWAKPIVKIARPSCVSAGFVSTDISTYPFAPDLNYDFERGLIKQVTSYNDANVKVSESVYTYQRTGTPVIVTGLKFDNNATIKSYLKYNVYTSTGELEQQVTNKVYDLNSTTLYQQTSTAYTYGSTAHKLPTKIQTTKSDGTVENNFIKYTKDYNTATRSDFYTIALYNLQQQNINTQVESYTEVVRGGTSKIVAASLTKFNSFAFTGYNLHLPAQTLSFFDQDGVTSSSFTVSTITSGMFINDTRYIVQQNMTAYDTYGMLQTTDNNRRSARTVLSDTKHLPIAVFGNATVNEIGYYTPNYQPTVPYFTYALVSGNNTYTRTINKNTTAKSYVFSAWVTSATAGSISLVLKGTDNVPHTYNLPYSAVSGVSKYYEVKVPVAALSSTFTASYQISVSGGPSIGDVLLYPENAEVVTYKYDQYRNKIEETNTNGVSTYFSSDAFGRPSLVYNQDKHIVQRYTYDPGVAVPELLTPAFSSDDNKVANTWTYVTFSTAITYNPCAYSNLKYTWSFGDGTANVVATTNASQTHRFTNQGTYTVTLTISADGFTSKSFTYSITILPEPPRVVPITFFNNTTTDGTITQVNFLQNGVVRYSFTGSELASGGQMIAVGTYAVSVKKSVGTGAGAVGNIYINVSGGSSNNTSECKDLPLPNGSFGTMQITVNSSHTIAISANDGNCI
jgi:YD repeat-containing protein